MKSTLAPPVIENSRASYMPEQTWNLLNNLTINLNVIVPGVALPLRVTAVENCGCKCSDLDGMKRVGGR